MLVPDNGPWKRIERIGNAVLLLGDCLEILPTLAKVDAVITDPPFEDEAHTQQRRALGRGSEDGRRDILNAALPFPGITETQRINVSYAIRELCEGWALVFCQAEAVAKWKDTLEAAGCKYKRAMVWIKPDGMPQFSGDRPGMGYESIVAVWCGQGASTWNGGGKHGVFTIPKHDAGSGHGGASNEHPTQKPRRLMNELVGLFTQPLQTVCDPFMGSGTTAVACANLGRAFVGIEIHEPYFEIACERIENSQRQERLFA
jgi:site-specific DNA-methyltransferase (adenine-specific)